MFQVRNRFFATQVASFTAMAASASCSRHPFLAGSILKYSAEFCKSWASARTCAVHEIDPLKLTKGCSYFCFIFPRVKFCWLLGELTCPAVWRWKGKSWVAVAKGHLFKDSAVNQSPHIKMTFVNCRFAINLKKKCAFYRLIIDFIDKLISWTLNAGQGRLLSNSLRLSRSLACHEIVIDQFK